MNAKYLLRKVFSANIKCHQRDVLANREKGINSKADKLRINSLGFMVAISSTVNVRIFRTKVISAAFSTVHVTRKDAETTFVRKTRAQKR